MRLSEDADRAPDAGSAYHPSGGQKTYSVEIERTAMPWQFVNAMTYENETHRVRRVGNYWVAERKTSDGGREYKIGGSYHRQTDATDACERDAFASESER